MRLLLVGSVLALMMGSAQAQLGSINPAQSQMNNAANVGNHASNSMHQGDEAKAVKANDKAYNAVLKNLPDKQYDPWHGVR